MNTIGSGGLMSAMMSGLQGTRPSPQQLAQQLFASADSNNDGSVSQSEFTSLLQSGNSSTGSDTINGLFSQLDSNGDGTLSSQEVSDAVSNLLQQMRQQMSSGADAMGNMPPPPPPSGDAASNAADFISKADSNGDGSLDKSEFTAALQNMQGNGSSSDATARIDAMFNAADTNGDGVISQDELQTAMANHQPPPPPPQQNADSSGSGNTNSSSTTDQTSFLIQALLNQYTANNTSGSTLSATA